MTKFKTVLFDWEGVMGLQDTQPFGWLMERLTKEYPVTKDQAVQALGGAIDDFMIAKINNQTFWQRVGQSLGVTFSDEFQKTIWAEWHGAKAIPEMEELVHEVKARGLRAIVFSNILPTSAAKIREIAGYEGFDAEILSCDVGLKKPDLEIYHKAIEIAGCSPEECIFIDDKEVNLTPARQLGMVTVLGTNPEQIKKALLSII